MNWVSNRKKSVVWIMLKRWTFINLGQPASLYLLTDLFYCSYFEEKCIKKC